jgi:hypothetical protein
MRPSRTAVFLTFCTVVMLAGPALAAEGPKQKGSWRRWRPKDYRDTFTAEEKTRPYVQATTHDLHEFPFIDGQWEGILADSDGDVWFAVSSHSDELPGQLFVYKREADKVYHVADLGQATGEKLTGNPPQDKIHSQMFQEGEYIYCGTCEGHAIRGNPYKGGYWLRIHRNTGVVENLGKSITNDGLLCVSYDPIRKVLYGHTNRTGELTVFDPATRKERICGVPWQDVIDRWKADPSPKKPKEIWPRGLTHMITTDGRVFGVKRPPGTFWCYDPRTDEITTFRAEMPLPREVAELPDSDAGLSPKENKARARTLKQWRHSAFHLHWWDEQDGCFYIIRSFDQMLCRFHPPSADGERAARVECIHEMGGRERLWGNRPAACTLVMHDRTVYYTPTTGWGGIAYLTSYDLKKDKFTDHGPIITEGDRRVCEIHSLDVGADGKLYMVAFTYNIENEDPDRPWSRRGRWTFHPRFAIIDPETDCITPGGK